MWLLSKILDWASGGGESRRAFNALEAEVAALSPEEAWSEMERLLANPALYEVVESARGVEPELPSSVAALFGRYERISERYGGTVLDRSAIGPSEYLPGYIRIGSDSETHCEIVTRRSGDAVRRTDGTERSSSEVEEFPTVYHLLLFDARIIHPEAFETKPGA